jgi:hypothetical protein
MPTSARLSANGWTTRSRPAFLVSSGAARSAPRPRTRGLRSSPQPQVQPPAHLPERECRRSKRSTRCSGGRMGGRCVKFSSLPAARSLQSADRRDSGRRLGVAEPGRCDEDGRAISSSACSCVGRLSSTSTSCQPEPRSTSSRTFPPPSTSSNARSDSCWAPATRTA